MNLKNEIQAFQPYNEQENVDKENFLHYLDLFDNLYTRENKIAHISASCWIVNEHFDKVLMVHHNIYQSYSWVGGHADGDHNLLEVALREAKEETGVTSLKRLDNEIFAIDILPVFGHMKHNQYVSSHLHLNVTYACTCNEKDPLFVKEDENSDVCWIAIDDLETLVNEKQMLVVYHKLNEKIIKYKEKRSVC